MKPNCHLSPYVQLQVLQNGEAGKSLLSTSLTPGTTFTILCVMSLDSGNNCEMGLFTPHFKDEETKSQSLLPGYLSVKRKNQIRRLGLSYIPTIFFNPIPSQGNHSESLCLNSIVVPHTYRIKLRVGLHIGEG